MSIYDFQTETHGKWILAGEHAVLRGHSALVFPVLGKTLRLCYRATETPLTLRYEGVAGQTAQHLFWRLLGHVREILREKLPVLKGHIDLVSDIPIGCGMGASAALCVAVARWLSFQLKALTVEKESIAHFARTLENFFHGQSSGLDIVGVAAAQGHHFQSGKATLLEQSWHPCWYLSFSGVQSMTSTCIERVKALWLKDAAQASAIDQAMEKSVSEAKAALADTSAGALIRLATAIEEAADCFYRWGLVSESLQSHMHALKAAGALAAKPTGSGGGGYVLSLWPTPAMFDAAQTAWSPMGRLPERIAQFIDL